MALPIMVAFVLFVVSRWQLASPVYSTRLQRELEARRKRPSQQFGQSGDTSTFNGATGCTHTVLQWLIWRTKGKWQTHDQISRVALYPWPAGNRARRGLRPSEVQRVINHYGLDYKIVFGWSALQVAHASKLGLVGFAHVYGWWPERRGYTYNGVKADGHPNGYADITKYSHGGRTQLTGFNNGRHMGMLIGYAPDPDGPDLYYTWEPNHGSPARPEKPPYDRVSWTQFYRVYDSYQRVAGLTRYAIVRKGAKQDG